MAQKPPIKKAAKTIRPRQVAPTKRQAAQLDAAEIEAIFAQLKKVRPDPKTELHFTNPFTLLVAVVLSAQMTDAGVNKATPALFAAADTPAKMLALGEARVRDYVKSINFNNTKAKNVIGLSQALVRDHGGDVPRTHKELEALPGVGRKTANVMMNEAFGMPTLAVDTHVFRVANRVGLAKGKTPDEVEAQLLKIVPKAYMLGAHHWLILHGRYVCIARSPKCYECPIYAYCRWPDKDMYRLPPIKSKPAKSTAAKPAARKGKIQ